jgi:hypothetical protein
MLRFLLFLGYLGEILGAPAFFAGTLLLVSLRYRTVQGSEVLLT